MAEHMLPVKIKQRYKAFKNEFNNRVFLTARLCTAVRSIMHSMTPNNLDKTNLPNSVVQSEKLPEDVAVSKN
jgi:hypothetical protein